MVPRLGWCLDPIHKRFLLRVDPIEGPKLSRRIWQQDDIRWNLPKLGAYVRCGTFLSKCVLRVHVCGRKISQVPGCTGSMHAPSCELWQSPAKFGELWRTHNAYSREPPRHLPEFPRRSLTFTRVPVKVPSASGWPSESDQGLAHLFFEHKKSPVTSKQAVGRQGNQWAPSLPSLDLDWTASKHVIVIGNVVLQCDSIIITSLDIVHVIWFLNSKCNRFWADSIEAFDHYWFWTSLPKFAESSTVMPGRGGERCGFRHSPRKHGYQNEHWTRTTCLHSWMDALLRSLFAHWLFQFQRHTSLASRRVIPNHVWNLALMLCHIISVRTCPITGHARNKTHVQELSDRPATFTPSDWQSILGCANCFCHMSSWWPWMGAEENALVGNKALLTSRSRASGIGVGGWRRSLFPLVG